MSGKTEQEYEEKGEYKDKLNQRWLPVNRSVFKCAVKIVCFCSDLDQIDALLLVGLVLATNHK